MSTETETAQENVQNEAENQHVGSTGAENEHIESSQESQGEQNAQEEVSEENERQVPLSALQKERRKRQEAEYEREFYKDLNNKYLKGSQPQEESRQDEDRYDPVTKEELGKSKQEILRDVREQAWMERFPERVEEVNENLQTFLKQRPHLTSAIDQAPNRYQEAWTLMNALSPKQKAKVVQQAAAQKKSAPNAPTQVPKAAGVNQTLDVMNMTDKEFNEWRRSLRSRRGA